MARSVPRPAGFLLAVAALGWSAAAAQPAPLRPPLPSAQALAASAAPLPPVAYAPAEDRWWARDKLQHLTFSFLWTLGTQYVLVEKAGRSNEAALPASAASGAAVGLSKELFDWRVGPSRRFSTRDLAADAAGILLAVGLIAL